MSNVGSHGRGKFAERFCLIDAERKKQNAKIKEQVEAKGLEAVSYTHLTLPTKA